MVAPKSSPDPLADLSVADRNDLESMLLDFDGGWKRDLLDRYAAQVASHPNQDYQKLALAELVKIDMQRSWTAGKGRLIEEYVRRFPSLGSTDSVSADLIAAEYDVRSGLDQELDLTSYASRFPNQFREVEKLVSQLFRSNASSVALKPSAENPLQLSVDTRRLDQIREPRVRSPQHLSEVGTGEVEPFATEKMEDPTPTKFLTQPDIPRTSRGKGCLLFGTGISICLFMVLGVVIYFNGGTWLGAIRTGLGTARSLPISTTAVTTFPQYVELRNDMV